MLNFCGGFNFAIFAGPCSNREIKNILFSNPHTSVSPITGDQHVTIHVEGSNNAISSMHFHDDRACNSSLLRAPQLASEIPGKFLEPIRKISSPRRFQRIR